MTIGREPFHGQLAGGSERFGRRGTLDRHLAGDIAGESLEFPGAERHGVSRSEAEIRPLQIHLARERLRSRVVPSLSPGNHFTV